MTLNEYYAIYVEGYVGFSPSQATVVVAHQGTVPSRMLVLFLSTSIIKAEYVFSQADITDSDVFLKKLDADLFPGVSSSIKAHSGFANEQAK